MIPRPEYPRPQFQRDEWINLNGTWTFEFDFGKSGIDRNLMTSEGFDREITVPFCPESELSGVGHKDFIEMMWYHRTIDIPSSWSGKSVFLNFGAVDFECEAFVNGVSVGTHWGGTSSFSFDISGAVQPGSSHHLVLMVRDELRSGFQTGGKQCEAFASRGCSYTRTTGIWQTVWMEAIDTFGLKSVHVVPDVDSSSFVFIPEYYATAADSTLTIEVKDGTAVVARREVRAANGVPVAVELDDPKLWAPGNPHLYDLVFFVSSEAGEIDSVRSYAGLRKVHIEGNKVLLNNQPLYQRLVLDQGFYPDGIWTAPNDGALKRDIELSMAAGFNGARLHQKVFEERFHYWADRLGYLTWGETSSWGLNLSTTEAARNFLSEWREIVVRDRNHPSIITWSPYNETQQNVESPQHGRSHVDAYELTRSLDPSRPVNDSSGYIHYITDVYTVHNYTQDPDELRGILDPAREGGVFRNFPEHDAAYAGQPYIIDEFGGIGWNPKYALAASGEDRSVSWGYGNSPKSLDEFYTRLEGQVRTVLSFDHICGFCYTQLTDVEQEQNGVYFYDRTSKFDMALIKTIFEQAKP
jgi:beta-galactosidase/beta-glucuronidase